MGTRSITKIQDQSGIVYVCMYRQYDGYLSGHGKELYDFLSGIILVNGFNSETKAMAANGIGCLSAQMIAHFKTEIGQFYIEPSTTSQIEEYNYTVIVDKLTGDIRIEVSDYLNKVFFAGTLPQFLVYILESGD